MPRFGREEENNHFPWRGGGELRRRDAKKQQSPISPLKAQSGNCGKQVIDLNSPPPIFLNSILLRSAVGVFSNREESIGR